MEKNYLDKLGLDHVAGHVNKKLTVLKTLPNASSYYLGKYCLYMGENTLTLTKGSIYECQIVPESSPVAYTWVSLSQGALDLSYLTAEDIDDLMQSVAAEQWSYLADIIVDDVISKTKVWSSDKVNAELLNTLDDSKTYTDEQIAKFKTASYQIVTSLEEMIDDAVLYLMAVGGESGGLGTQSGQTIITQSGDTIVVDANRYYDIYALIDDVPTPIGTTKIHLDDYYTITETNQLFMKKIDGLTKSRYNSEIGDIIDLQTDFTATTIVGALIELMTKAKTFETVNIDFNHDW